VSGHHLAQFNIARMVAPLGSDAMAGFEQGLDPVNAVADRSPGFVWRLEDDEGHATSYRPYEDDRLIVNLSVWESIEALRDFTYRPEHTAFLRRRRAWFEPASEAILVLWWVPEGHRPTVAESVDRLDRLRRHGPTPEAFTFRDRFDPPEA
jgi:heme-degrading monooxygenase HmoA